MTFLLILSFLCADLVFGIIKVHIRMLHWQILNRRYKKQVTFVSQINFLEVHWAHSGYLLVENDLFDLCFSTYNPFIWWFLYGTFQYCS